MEHVRRVKLLLPPISGEEDAAITSAALSDPDAQPLSDAELARFRPVWDYPDLVRDLQKHGKLGRPPLPDEARKQRVTMYLDRDIVERLKSDGKGWQTRANAHLRASLGLK